MGIRSPCGAEHLYLGTVIGKQWWNDIGALDAKVTDPCEPTPLERMSWGAMKARYR
ncbi:MAG: hypothetical protein R3E12_13170 [Candidatus Eisenbacteria bacterium]